GENAACNKNVLFALLATYLCHILNIEMLQYILFRQYDVYKKRTDMHTKSVALSKPFSKTAEKMRISKQQVQSDSAFTTSSSEAESVKSNKNLKDDRKSERKHGVLSDLDSYEYHGKLIVVKRKPPVIFERNAPKIYDVDDMSKYFSSGSKINSRRIADKYGDSYYHDTCGGYRSSIRSYNDGYSRYRPLSSIDNDIIYDSGYYRVNDPAFRSHNIGEIMNFRVSKNRQGAYCHGYPYPNDYYDGRGDFERALSSNIRGDYYC
ncbi:hypothetical protein GJ496_011938, partial [Pomphorhynchus laevis]